MLSLVAGENKEKTKRWVNRLQQANSTTMNYKMNSNCSSLFYCEKCEGPVSNKAYSYCPWCGKKITGYTYQKE